MRSSRMTIRGMLIAIAIEGLVLGACIGSPWLIVVPLKTALVFVPQLIVIAVCAYLATREWSARRRNRASGVEPPGGAASPEIWYIEMGSSAVDARGIVFESNQKSSA